MPCNEQSTVVFQEGPPVCWLFLPGRLFVGWSALIGKTFGWPISSSIVTAASDKARPASRKPEIYPPVFHHSFTISAQRETERTKREQEGYNRDMDQKKPYGKHTERQMHSKTYTCVHTVLTCPHWLANCDTHIFKPQYFSKLTTPPSPPYSIWNPLWLTSFSLKSSLKWFSRNTWTV